MPPLRKEGRKQKEVMSHKFWQIDHGSIRVNCVRGKTTGCYLLESPSSISMSQDVLAPRASKFCPTLF